MPLNDISPVEWCGILTAQSPIWLAIFEKESSVPHASNLINIASNLISLFSANTNNEY